MKIILTFNKISKIISDEIKENKDLNNFKELMGKDEIIKSQLNSAEEIKENGFKNIKNIMIKFEKNYNSIQKLEFSIAKFEGGLGSPKKQTIYGIK